MINDMDVITTLKKERNDWRKMYYYIILELERIVDIDLEV